MTLIFVFMFCFDTVGQGTLTGNEIMVGQMEFEQHQSIALIKNVATGNIRAYKEDEVVYLSLDFLKHVEILNVKKNGLVVSINQNLQGQGNGKIIWVTKGNFLPGSNTLRFLKGVNIDRIRFFYINEPNNEPSGFKLLTLNEGTLSIGLTGNYKPAKQNVLNKELFKEVKVRKVSKNKVIIDKESIRYVAQHAEPIIKHMVEEIEDKEISSHQILNLKLSSSAAEIILGSWGVLVSRFFLEKLPQKIDLREGDLIKRINHKPINNLTDIYYIIKEIKSNQNIVRLEVDLIRDYRLIKKYFEIR